MANAIAIVGESGTGKSTCIGGIPELGIEGLKPEETFIINVKGKPLPFRGWKKKYSPFQGDTGNYLSTSDPEIIKRAISKVVKDRKDINNIVLDDMQYIMSEEFMANAMKSGFDKFNKMAKNMYDVLNMGINITSDINFIVLTHSHEENGTSNIKTLGKMLDDKVNLSGLFTVVLYTMVKTNLKGDSEYKLVTNRHVNDRGIVLTAKSPVGMFEEKLIPNDMGLVLSKVKQYNEE